MSNARLSLQKYFQNQRQQLAALEEKLQAVIENPDTQQSTQHILMEDLEARMSPELIKQRWSNTLS